MGPAEVTKSDLEIAGCLRRLFKQHFILRSKNKQWFQHVIDHRMSLQNILNSFFLTLIVDESLGVLYLLETSSDIEDSLAFQMGRKKRLDAYTSLLLLQLRHERFQFYLNPDEAEVPLVRQEELREYLKNFDTHEVDARFERSFQAALKSLKSLQVLFETQQDSQIYEVSAVCDLLLPLDDIQSYRKKIETYFAKSKNTPPLVGETHDH